MMAHRHLILAYAITWALQLGYVCMLAVKWRQEKRHQQKRSNPAG